MADIVQTPGFHESGSKWHLAPNFTFAALSENDSIRDAIDLVLRAKQKHLRDTQKQQLIHYVENYANGQNIKHLNALNDQQWDQMDGIPLLCKIYLRHLLCQCFAYKSKQELLEHDFNWGLPIDWNAPQIHSLFTKLKGFGFDADQCYEAIIVTDRQSVESVECQIIELKLAIFHSLNFCVFPKSMNSICGLLKSLNFSKFQRR